MRTDYGDSVSFYIVYIHEAHPGPESGYEEPKSIQQRRAMAEIMRAQQPLSIPVLLDDMDNCVSLQYAAWPQRAYLIDADGKLVYSSVEGGPDTELCTTLEQSIQTLLEKF